MLRSYRRSNEKSDESKELAKLKVAAPEEIFNGEKLSPSMTFGPAGGTGAGLLRRRGHHLPRGVMAPATASR